MKFIGANKMFFKKALILVLAGSLIFSIQAKKKKQESKGEEKTKSGVYLRYNVVGYNPSRSKRMVIMSEYDIMGQKWEINDSKGTTILSGKFPKSMYGVGDHTPMPFNYFVDFSNLTELGTYTFETEGAKTGKINIAKDPYGWILEEPLRWFRVARCGSHDALDHGFCHGGDTACTVYYREGIRNDNWKENKEGKKVNGFGGWHDAGDYLKFNLTVSYSAYFILRSYEMNPEIFDGKKNMSKTDLIDILDEAKWGLEFLMKSMPDDSTFIMMVGGYDDHNVGFRLAQDDHLDGQRPALCAMSPTQMGYTAAALAVGSIIFEKIGKTEDAKRYRQKAEQVFAGAISDKAVAPAWMLAEYHFYNDDTKYDNLELAAAELYRLTKDEKYLEHAKKFSDKARAAGWRAWESVNMPAHLSLMDAYPVVKNDLRIDLDAFHKNSKKPGNIWGLPLKYVWGGLYSYIGIGAAAMEFQLKTKNRKYSSLARNMIDYMLGLNNWGICFVATEKVDYTITRPFSQTYFLQSHLFPIGAISEGPGDRRSWEENKVWFGYDHNAEPTEKFNTEKGVFHDHHKDYMTMETTIAGVSDGIYMLALAAKIFKD